MPQLELWSYPSQLFWLALSFGLIYFLCWKFFLPGIERILSERQERINADIRRAAKLKETAEKTLREYEGILSVARMKAQTIIKEASLEISEENDKSTQAVTSKLAKRAEEASKSIEAAKAEALENIWPVVCETADAAMKRLVGKSPSEEEIGLVVKKLREEVV